MMDTTRRPVKTVRVGSPRAILQPIGATPTVADRPSMADREDATGDVPSASAPAPAMPRLPISKAAAAAIGDRPGSALLQQFDAAAPNAAPQADPPAATNEADGSALHQAPAPSVSFALPSPTSAQALEEMAEQRNKAGQAAVAREAPAGVQQQSSEGEFAGSDVGPDEAQIGADMASAAPALPADDDTTGGAAPHEGNPSRQGDEHRAVRFREAEEPSAAMQVPSRRAMHFRRRRRHSSRSRRHASRMSPPSIPSASTARSAPTEPRRTFGHLPPK